MLFTIYYFVFDWYVVRFPLVSGPFLAKRWWAFPRVIALLCLSCMLEVGVACAGLDRLVFNVSVPLWLKYWTLIPHSLIYVPHSPSIRFGCGRDCGSPLERATHVKDSRCCPLERAAGLWRHSQQIAVVGESIAEWQEEPNRRFASRCTSRRKV